MAGGQTETKRNTVRDNWDQTMSRQGVSIQSGVGARLTAGGSGWRRRAGREGSLSAAVVL